MSLRQKERELLTEHYQSERAELVVIKGRRGVGKTHLVNEVCNHKFLYSFCGVPGIAPKSQVAFAANSLNVALTEVTWFTIFEVIRRKLEEAPKGEKQVVFLDEVSWLATPGSDFVMALEYAWNSFFSTTKNLLLILSGSATTWINKHIVNNTGGLYRRITGLIDLEPFNLAQTKKFFQAKGINYSDLDLCEIYSLVGGVPQYLDYFKPGLSVSQNIDALIFQRNGFLKNEFKTIYSSLFYRSDKYLAIINALTTKKKGLTQKEIADIAKIPKNGQFSMLLQDLCDSGFVRKYYKYPGNKKDAIYQLIDLFSCFAATFEKEISSNHYSYAKNRNDAKIRLFLAFAFERVCLWHINQIEQGLKFNQIVNTISSYKGTHCQIDLIFERSDRIIHLVEVKYSDYPFEIDQNYYQDLLNKKSDFCNENRIKKTVLISMITTFGIKNSSHSSIVDSSMTLKNLFAESIE